MSRQVTMPPGTPDAAEPKMFRFRGTIDVVLIVAVTMAAGVTALGAHSPGPLPPEVKEVLIGYFGPASATHPDAGDLWCAASMAIDEANEKGGYNGLPFRLVTGWSENPWGTGVADVTRMAYVHKVWAIVGGIDGASAHLAEQVVAKARLVLMNPVATDKSVNMAGVSWMFSCVPPDDIQAGVLAKAITSKTAKQPFVVISAVDHDSHVFSVELLKAFRSCEIAPAFHFECDPMKEESSGVLERALQVKPPVVVLIANARGSARLLDKLRGRGYAGAVFGGPWMGRRVFLEQAGEAAQGVMFPHPLVTSPKFRAFAKRFAKRFGRAPDYAAAHTYDTLTLLMAAIRKAGLDRTGIRDAVKEIAPFSGVTGQIRWDVVGANSRSVGLGVVANGRVQPVATAPPASRH